MILPTFLLCAVSAIAVTVDENVAPKPVATTFQGVFIEDVSHAADVLMTADGFREEVVEAIAAHRAMEGDQGYSAARKTLTSDVAIVRGDRNVCAGPKFVTAKE